ncbi:MAG: bifunctional hydroxymethylpyrimidine kinase/phosphomethylpyrimidine kinase, partial [Clostridia bacterium]|nr:bifunctional hydroxymethylpyrimidine kinase/phosphomethylpyrimidine kinase [Clostridia bacterium]
MTKRVVLISDMSGLGNCSAGVSVAVISAMGHECVFVPTAILSAQTGFKDFYIADMTHHLSGFLTSIYKIDSALNTYYIGFLQSSKTAECIYTYLNNKKDSKPFVIYDPIMGDNGSRFSFVDDNLQEKITDIAVMSSIITPNLTELCLLAGENYDDICTHKDRKLYACIRRMCESIIQKGVSAVVVTGIEPCSGIVANAVVQMNGMSTYEYKRIGGSYSGTGDIFTSVLCGGIMNGIDIAAACKKAGDFVNTVLTNSGNTITDRNFGIPYQP